jgi:hypothetical protein
MNSSVVKTEFGLALIATCALVHGSARADERTYSFDCDTPPGHFSSWTMSTNAVALVVSGTIQLNEIRVDKKKWSVVANVFLRGGEDGKTTYGFRAYDVDRQQKSLHLELLKPGGHLDFGSDSMKPGKKPFPFRLELTASGALSVDVSGAKQTAELGHFKAKKIYFGCSTGDFSFENIRIDETSRAP